jgi:hypothetical protein
MRPLLLAGRFVLPLLLPLGAYAQEQPPQGIEHPTSCANFLELTTHGDHVAALSVIFAEIQERDIPLPTLSDMNEIWGITEKYCSTHPNESFIDAAANAWELLRAFRTKSN